MVGDILVIDCVATNRIVLKVKLLAAQYSVRPCASLSEARDEVAACLPDMILVDTNTQTDEVLAFCRALKADPATSLIPIIATGGFANPQDRVAALMAGADDVLTKPFDDKIIQARIRSLLRSRDAQAELRMREGTRRALGFAEGATPFAPPARIVIASQHQGAGRDLAQLPLENCQIEQVAVEGVLAGHELHNDADLYIVDFRQGVLDDNVLFRLLSELRSRSGTRHASIMALLPGDARHAAALALDLGANDIISSDVEPEEIHHRCTVLLQAKHEADSLRRTVETGLEAAITDPLTGLFNRRYAIPHLSRLADKSRKTGRKFAIMALDLDHFKSINDTHGHKAGDEVLKAVAQRLHGNLRAVDLLARIGGEEFLVAIPNSDTLHARTAAERLRKLIGDTPFFIGDRRTEISVTVSVGVSLSGGDDDTSEGAPPLADSLDDLVNAADVALYAAKNAGRNKVSLFAA